jgi:hypothetical protein
MPYLSAEITQPGNFRPGLGPLWRAGTDPINGGTGRDGASLGLMEEPRRMAAAHPVETTEETEDPTGDTTPTTYRGAVIYGLIRGLRYRVYFVVRPPRPEGATQDPEPHIESQEFTAQREYHLIDCDGPSPYDEDGRATFEDESGQPKYTATGDPTRTVLANPYGGVEFATYWGPGGQYTTATEWPEIPQN